MSHVCTMELYKKRTDPRLEKYALANGGAPCTEIGYTWHQPVEPNPVSIEVAGFRTYRVNNKYSVLYLPTVVGSYDTRADCVKGFELKVDLQSFRPNEGQCIIMPTQGYTAKGLTDKCACLGCIRKIISCAEKEERDAITEVLQQLSRPIRYRSITDKSSQL